MPTVVPGTWHSRPSYSLFLAPPLLEAGKQLKLAPSHSEGFSGEKCGLRPLTAMDSNPASVTQMAQVEQVQSC